MKYIRERAMDEMQAGEREEEKKDKAVRTWSIGALGVYPAGGRRERKRERRRGARRARWSDQERKQSMHHAFIPWKGIGGFALFPAFCRSVACPWPFRWPEKGHKRTTDTRGMRDAPFFLSFARDYPAIPPHPHPHLPLSALHLCPASSPLTRL